MRREHHKAKKVRLEGWTGEIAIDHKIVDLIVYLNKLGWMTRNSCQNDVHNRVWISFDNSDGATAFMGLITRESSYLRPFIIQATTQHYDKQPTRFRFPKRWWVDAFSRNLCGSYTYVIHISIRFPKKHLKEVTRIVKDHYESKTVGAQISG